MKRWLKEPFVHFVLLGVLLFATQDIWSPPTPDSRDIVMSKAAQQRLFDLWAVEALRQPTKEDQQAIIADYVREEALVREAELLGLADGDTVVRRRLAQKMRELIEDRVDLSDPGEDELKRWFENNSKDFDTPERRTFQHIFFAGQTPTANDDKITAAQSALQSDVNWQTLGDAFIEKRVYSDINIAEVARIFGQDFADQLFTLGPGRWSSPIESAFGQHLVRVAAISQPQAADFDASRADILNGWREAERRKANSQAVNTVISRYNVDVQ